MTTAKGLSGSAASFSPRGVWLAMLLAAPAAVLACRGREPATPPAASAPAPVPVPEAAAPPPPARPIVTILYSNDVRGHVAPDAKSGFGGLARRGSVVDRARMEGGPFIQLDAGDLLARATDEQAAGTTYGPDDRTHVVLTSYRRMGVDVVNLGESELALGPARLSAALDAAELKAVAANVVDARTKRHPFSPTEIVKVGDVSVGVFGIVDLPAERADEVRRHGFKLEDATEAARKSTEALHASGATLIVGLFQIAGGLPRVQEILAQANSIDVVILGRGPEAAEPHLSTRVGRTLVVSAASFGTELGRLAVSGVHPGADPAIDDEGLPLGKELPEQMGVRLAEQATIERLRAESERKAAALLKKSKGKPPHPVYESWTYASAGACAACHLKETQQWSSTDHAHAFATLEHAKHSHDPECLGCHTVAYLQPGGTRSQETLTGYFLNVGCEACHGPSAYHVRSIDKKIGTSRRVGAEVCYGCHTPDQNIGAFDYEKALKAVLGPSHGPLVNAAASM